jgi:hypothetical protein
MKPSLKTILLAGAAVTCLLSPPSFAEDNLFTTGHLYKGDFIAA